MIKNGEFPPAPKDEEEKAFLQSRGVVFLENEYEHIVIDMFLNALESRYMGVGLNFEYAKCYCDKFGLDILEIWGVLNRLLNVINRG